MRKPKGKLVALLAGAVVVVLVAVSWRDIYCHLFLDPELVGRWKSYRDENLFLRFDRIGRVQVTSGAQRERIKTDMYYPPAYLFDATFLGTYGIHGNTTLWIRDSRSAEVTSSAYRLIGPDSLALGPHFFDAFRRVPDDS